MNLTAIAEPATWVALVLSLVAAAAFSTLAYLRPGRMHLWFAAGGLGVALLAASAVNAPAHPGVALLITVLGIIVAVLGGSPAATTALELAMRGAATPGLHGGILVADKSPAGEDAHGLQPTSRREVLRGGLTIGILERIASAGAIIAGFPEGLAIVVAVKGVGRFTELEASEARERFIIGTFASLIWACAAALTVHLATR